MPNELVRSEFLSRVRLALSRAQDASGLGHSGLIGRAREILVKDLLRPVLPPYVELGSGKIGDSEGQMSAEMDVVIYSSATLPPLVLEHGFGFYPADPCIYAIEVKNAKQVHSTDLRSLKTFQADYPEATACLLYRGKERLMIGGVLCLPVETFLKQLVPNTMPCLL